MRVKYISKDATTETKTKRELTVESTAVIHMHRMCIARRDSLLFFNQKSFIMRANDEGNSPRKPAITADEIINSFATTSTEVRSGRNLLKQMCVASLMRKDKDFRKNMFVSLWEDLDRLLKSIEIFKGN